MSKTLTTNVLYKFEYNLKDHLGNTRVVFGGHTGGKTEYMQRTGYYPFGMVMAQQNYTTFEGLNSTHSPLENKFLYNGKEWQNDEIGGANLDWYDYGARFYDAALARFTTQDPLAENFSHQSPYVYADNDPINNIDFMGMNAWKPNGDGTWTAEKGDGAETLAQDAGISREKAYQLMDEQGHGTYVDEKDGVTKSDIHEGEVVDVNSGEVAEMDSQIEANTAEINAGEREIKELTPKIEEQRFKERVSNKLKNEGHGSDPKLGNHFGMLIKETIARRNKERLQNDSAKVRNRTDSLKRVNRDLKTKREKGPQF